MRRNDRVKGFELWQTSGAATVALAVGALVTARRVGTQLGLMRDQLKIATEQLEDTRAQYAGEMSELRASREAALRPLLLPDGAHLSDSSNLMVSLRNAGVGPALAISLKAWVIDTHEEETTGEPDYQHSGDYVGLGVVEDATPYQLEPSGHSRSRTAGGRGSLVEVRFKYQDVFGNQFPDAAEDSSAVLVMRRSPGSAAAKSEG